MSVPVFVMVVMMFLVLVMTALVASHFDGAVPPTPHCTETDRSDREETDEPDELCAHRTLEYRCGRSSTNRMFRLNV
jgi:hypothetical protein